VRPLFTKNRLVFLYFYSAVYAKETLPRLMEKYIRQERVNAHKLRNENLPDDKKYPFNPKLFPMLDPAKYEEVSKAAHEECNQLMIDTQPLVNLSGTTAISAAFHNGHIMISNVGDSRAILGYRDKGSVVAIPLSKDQTPWRKDERIRIEEAGGRVLTLAQLEGKTSTTERVDSDRYLGEKGDIDEAGDPPRVWLPDQDMPGTSFTRSLGDSIADKVGVNGEPEFFSKEITDEDEILVLASDGTLCCSPVVFMFEGLLQVLVQMSFIFF
jgi:serine/threonine protein phosphatase PrpC